MLQLNSVSSNRRVSCGMRRGKKGKAKDCESGSEPSSEPDLLMGCAFWLPQGSSKSGCQFSSENLFFFFLCGVRFNRRMEGEKVLGLIRDLWERGPFLEMLTQCVKRLRIHRISLLLLLLNTNVFPWLSGLKNSAYV